MNMNYEKMANGDLFKNKLNIQCKVNKFEDIINGDFFINKLSLPGIINIALCSKGLYSDLSNERMSASTDLNIYTWSRSWTMKVYIWGRAWSKNVAYDYFSSCEDRILAGDMRHMYDGTTLLHLDECSAEDDRFFEFLEEQYGYLYNYNCIEGKLSKEQERYPCPSRKGDYYV